LLGTLVLSLVLEVLENAHALIIDRLEVPISLAEEPRTVPIIQIHAPVVNKLAIKVDSSIQTVIRQTFTYRFLKRVPVLMKCVF
jgi:hypothetical protein